MYRITINGNPQTAYYAIGNRDVLQDEAYDRFGVCGVSIVRVK